MTSATPKSVLSLSEHGPRGAARVGDSAAAGALSAAEPVAARREDTGRESCCPAHAKARGVQRSDTASSDDNESGDDDDDDDGKTRGCDAEWQWAWTWHSSIVRHG